MRKILSVLIACMIFVAPAHSWGWFKKEEPKDPSKSNGYNGTLPSLEKKETQKPPATEKKSPTPIYEANEDFGDPSTLKPTPRENPAFVNIMLKTDKSSLYLNHVNEMISYIEKIIDSIENQESDQLFIAKARVFKFKVDHLKRTYDGKSESYYAGFRKLQEVGAHTETIATLRNEAVTYKKYLAYQTTGSVYNPANIATQLEYLKKELEDTLLILKDER